MHSWVTACPGCSASEATACSAIGTRNVSRPREKTGPGASQSAQRASASRRLSTSGAMRPRGGASEPARSNAEKRTARTSAAMAALVLAVLFSAFERAGSLAPPRGRMAPLVDKRRLADARCADCDAPGPVFSRGRDTFRVPMALHAVASLALHPGHAVTQLCMKPGSAGRVLVSSSAGG